MRLWPRPRLPEAPPRWDDLLPMEALLRGEIEDVLAVEQRQLWGRSLALGGRLRMPAGRALDVLRARLEPQGYTPFLRQDGATTWMCALPRAELAERSNPLVNLALFLATVLTTLLAGAWPMAGVAPAELWAHPGRLVAGLPFAASLLSILAVHEFGHYTVGRRHGMPISLPYFIPAPPPFFPVGTLGAVIRLRGPVRDRRSLFDMAVAGPLAGLVLAIPIVVLGLRFSTVVPSAGVGEGGLELGDSLLLLLLQRLVVGPLGADQTLLLHPVGVAGWFGLFVTALNLIPAGQLDGGHLVYAMFGRWHAWISKAAVGVLMAVGLLFGSPTWLVWSALIVVLMGFRHSPPMDDVTPLDGKRLALGLFALVLPLLLVPPVPLSIH